MKSNLSILHRPNEQPPRVSIREGRKIAAGRGVHAASTCGKQTDQFNPVSADRRKRSGLKPALRCLPCLALLTLVCNVAPAAESAQRPNIILVMTDDQGYGDLSFHGNPILKTPNLDSFARQSVRFTDFHVSPTCAPTRASLMTGRHEFRSGVTHTINERERLSLKAVTLPQILKTAGYTTGIFGKWHLGDEDAYQPGQRGFDEVFIHGAGGIGQTYVGSCGDAPGNTYFDPAIRHNGRFVKTKGYCSDVFFAQALQLMDAKRKEK
jgi:arylsulfatase